MQEFLEQLDPAVKLPAGIFADSCLVHCQTLEDEPWSTYTVDGKTIRESFEEWYFDAEQDSTQRIDCPFPCNPTCPLDSSSLRAVDGPLGITMTLVVLFSLL